MLTLTVQEQVFLPISESTRYVHSYLQLAILSTNNASRKIMDLESSFKSSLGCSAVIAWFERKDSRTTDSVCKIAQIGKGITPLTLKKTAPSVSDFII